jgi:hypothetical protein
MSSLDLPDDHAPKRRLTAFWLKGAVRNALKMVPLLLLSFGFTANAEAQPFANVPAPKLGPISLGMSLEEAQATLPTADWRVEYRLPSGKPREFAAVSALEWAGDKADIALVSSHYHRRIGLSVLVKDAEAQSCFERAKNWSIKLADATGPMIIPDSKGPEQAIPLGQSGFGLLLASREGRKWPIQRWSTQPPTVFSFTATPTFAPTSNYETSALVLATFTKVGCSVELTLEQRSDWPTEIPELPDAMQRIVLKPSIGRRHFLSSGLKAWIPPHFEGGIIIRDRSPRDILAETVMAQVRCQINRDNGIARQCKLAAGEPSFPSGLANALTSLGAAYQFDTSGLGLDIDDPAPLQVTFPVTLSPADIKATEFEAPTIPLKFPVRLPPNPERATPQEAIDKGLGANILFFCQIQSDQSVVCRIASFNEADSEKLTTLQRIYTPFVLELVHQLKVCPDGCETEPPVGAVFKYELRFRIGD